MELLGLSEWTGFTVASLSWGQAFVLVFGIAWLCIFAYISVLLLRNGMQQHLDRVLKSVPRVIAGSPLW